jgi:uncharacterized CHY-type Zn-finger protein
VKQKFAARELEGGVVEAAHEVEVLCSICSDPVSREEVTTGTCTNCGQPWEPKQSVKIWATSVPWASGGVM